ncbi:hypothetical protein [Acinetobacter faecalis]|uniref:hypothetical protein n=1 Tax=Acinetobacter faecalis TaxID=2665161 RepID=UPI002A91ADCB|nr:hypothetical protein [Acinetobacter faecalis]MDY6457721.1 hypothetical protein [Acinetobacter faecalis]
MQFMKSKSITFVLLVTFVMSWTGIAFAFVPASSNAHSLSVQTNQKLDFEHCEKQVDIHKKHVIQHDMNTENEHCEQSSISHSNHQNSHVPCDNCSITQCQNSICSFNLLESSTLNLSTFNPKNIFNSVYGIFHSSDFKQDILRPPQA